MLSLAEMSAAVLAPCGTLDPWLYGHRVPSEERQAEVLKKLRTAPPSAAMQRKLFRLHGLSWDKTKKRWKLRLTLDMGTKVVGKRVAVWLRTGNEQEAIAQRLAIVESYRAIGLTVRERKIRRGL